MGSSLIAVSCMLHGGMPGFERRKVLRNGNHSIFLPVKAKALHSPQVQHKAAAPSLPKWRAYAYTQHAAQHVQRCCYRWCHMHVYLQQALLLVACCWEYPC